MRDSGRSGRQPQKGSPNIVEAKQPDATRSLASKPSSVLSAPRGVRFALLHFQGLPADTSASRRVTLRAVSGLQNRKFASSGPLRPKCPALLAASCKMLSQGASAQIMQICKPDTECMRPAGQYGHSGSSGEYAPGRSRQKTELSLSGASFSDDGKNISPVHNG
jgi:hypothetical protein